MRTSTPMWQRIPKSLLFVVSLLVMLAGSAAAYADSSVQISKNSDFSSSDRSFSTSDTLYVKVTTDQLDPTQIEDNEYKLEANGSGETLEGSLENNLDGTFTGKIALSELSGQTSSWTLSINIEDDNDHVFNSNTNLTISGLVDMEVYSTITAKVTTVGSNSITVADKMIQVTDSTSFWSANGASITLDDIDAGDRLSVKYFQRDESYVAVSIRKIGTGYARLNIEGNLQNVYGDSLRLCDFNLLVNNDTEIHGDNNSELSLSALDSTMSVEAHAVTTADGWLLQSLNVKSGEKEGSEDGEHDEEESVSCKYGLSGYVEAVNADSGFVQMGGLTLWINEETDFEDGLSGLASLMIGTRTEIEFKENGDGQWVVDEIKSHSEDERDFEISGTIQAVSDGQITVNGTQISITDQTVIHGEEESMLASELYSGLEVSVDVKQRIDGTFEALKIEIDHKLDEEIELEGKITAIKSDSLIEVQQTWIKVNAETRIKNESDQSLAFGDLSEDLTANVEAVRSLDTVLTATKIEVKNRYAEDRIETEGTIESVTMTSITLNNGRTFTINAATEITASGRLVLTIDSLSAGDYVEIKGAEQTDGTYLALEIKRKEEEKAHPAGQISGTVDVATADSIVVNGTTFRISAENTMFVRVESADQLESGDFVKVHYWRLTDGSLVARGVIKFDSTMDESAELEGTIDSVSTDLIVVAGVEVQLSDSTEVVSDSTLTTADLQAGMSVEVKGHHNASGQIVADVIEVEDVDIVASTIESTASAGASVTLAGKTVTVDDNTFIYDQNNQVLQPADLSAGMFVQVVSVNSTQVKAKATTQSSTSSAQRIEVLSSSSTTTDIEKNTQATPSAYKLGNNYPNPFNPTTNIRYELKQAAQVTLTVYNVLGQKVAQLVNKQMQPGNYVATWDATNVASGTYFVRMKVQNNGKLLSKQTQKMLLIK